MSVKLSKRLSYILRHAPESVGITLDSGGWVDLAKLCVAMNVGVQYIEETVASDSKKRYEIIDGRIRASQGHSVEVSLGYVEKLPPAVLYHGTHIGVRDKILDYGIRKMDRHHVHLSVDMETARAVGGRRGEAVIFGVHAIRMMGSKFYESTNGVWLVDYIDPLFIWEIK